MYGIRAKGSQVQDHAHLVLKKFATYIENPTSLRSRKSKRLNVRESADIINIFPILFPLV
jgi:hypothetical protein